MKEANSAIKIRGYLRVYLGVAGEKRGTHLIPRYVTSLDPRPLRGDYFFLNSTPAQGDARKELPSPPFTSSLARAQDQTFLLSLWGA